MRITGSSPQIGKEGSYRDARRFRVDYFNDQDEALDAVGLRD
jgi:hypothetical protein